MLKGQQSGLWPFQLASTCTVAVRHWLMTIHVEFIAFLCWFAFSLVHLPSCLRFNIIHQKISFIDSLATEIPIVHFCVRRESRFKMSDTATVESDSSCSSSPRGRKKANPSAYSREKIKLAILRGQEYVNHKSDEGDEKNTQKHHTPSYRGCLPHGKSPH